MALVLWVAFGSNAQAFVCIGSDCGVSIILQDTCVCKQGTCPRDSGPEGQSNSSQVKSSGSMEITSAGCCSCMDYKISAAIAIQQCAFSGVEPPSLFAVPVVSVPSMGDTGHCGEGIRAYLFEELFFKNYSLLITTSTILLI